MMIYWSHRCLRWLHVFVGAVVFLYASSAFGAATLQSGFPVTDTDTGLRNSITKAATVNAGSNTVLVVETFHEDATASTVSGITWNTTENFDKIDSTNATTFTRVEQWLLKAPSTGAHNVVVSFSGTKRQGCAVYALDGVDQTSSTRTPAKGAADSGTSVTRSVSGMASGDYLLDVLAIDSTGHTATAAGTGHAKDWGALTFGAGSTESQGGSNTDTGGAANWTWTTSGPNSHLAVAFIAAGGGGASPPKRLTLLGVGMGEVGIRTSTVDLSNLNNQQVLNEIGLMISITALILSIWAIVDEKRRR